MLATDLFCWFSDFGVVGLSLIRAHRDSVELDFADGLYVRIDSRPLGRCDVMIHRSGEDEPTVREGLDVWQLVELLRDEGKAIRRGLATCCGGGRVT